MIWFQIGHWANFEQYRSKRVRFGLNRDMGKNARRKPPETCFWPWTNRGGLHLIQEGLTGMTLSPHNAFIQIVRAWGVLGPLAFLSAYFPLF